MNRLFPTLALMVAAMSLHAEELTLQDGRKILLNDDGTWTFVSSDRLLGTADGREVRLREDGTWEYTGDIAPATVPVSGERLVDNFGDMVLTLKELAVETARSTSHKNSRKKTNSVFLVSIVNNGESLQSLDMSGLSVSVEDSGGREYDILAIEPGAVNLEPGEKALVTVRADGSPHWFTIKAMELRMIDESDEEVLLKGLMSDAKKRELAP